MSGPSGRTNQKLRTRNDLLDAAARLMQRGETPSLEEIAQAALVSRATAYRYFPSTEALMLEAAVHIAAPLAEDLFHGFPSADATERLIHADAALHDLVLANETPLRLMLANILQQSVAPGASGLPARQNRRSGLIRAALAPAAGGFSIEALELLSLAAALVMGTEGMVAAKDVLRLDDATTRRVKRWAIAALVEAARRHPTAPSVAQES